MTVEQSILALEEDKRYAAMTAQDAPGLAMSDARERGQGIGQVLAEVRFGHGMYSGGRGRSRTHQRRQTPLAGFEVRAPHRGRFSSRESLRARRRLPARLV